MTLAVARWGQVNQQRSRGEREERKGRQRKSFLLAALSPRLELVQGSFREEEDGERAVDKVLLVAEKPECFKCAVGRVNGQGEKG